MIWDFCQQNTGEMALYNRLVLNQIKTLLLIFKTDVSSLVILMPYMFIFYIELFAIISAAYLFIER